MTGKTLRLAAIVAALVPLACLASDQKPAAAPKANAGATKEKLPPVYDPDALGTLEIAAKKNACEQSNRRMFVHFGTNDCAACRLLNDVISEPKFQGVFMRQFIPAPIDVSPGSPNLAILKDWQIDPAKGLPAIAILDDKGKLVETTQDGEMAREAAKGKEAIQGWILKRFIADN